MPTAQLALLANYDLIAVAAEPEKLVSRDSSEVTIETTSLVSGQPARAGVETVGGDPLVTQPEPAPAVIDRAAQNAAVTDALAVIARRASVPVELVREAWSERAAIREYLGGQRQPLAEREAIGDLEEMFPRVARVSAKGARYVPDGDQYW